MNHTLRMPTSRALFLLPVAAAMLALALLDGPLAALLAGAGLDEEAVLAATPWLATLLAGGGFVLLVVGLFAMGRSASWRARSQPYYDALRPFAAEYGRGVIQGPDGVEVSLQRGGQVVDVRVGLGPGGAMTIVSPSPARQTLAWSRLTAPPLGPPAAWREVGTGAGWQLRAELPAMARPLLVDPELGPLVTRFFGFPEARQIVHEVGGIAITAAVPTPEAIQEQARLAVELAFSLRRVNG